MGSPHLSIKAFEPLSFGFAYEPGTYRIALRDSEHTPEFMLICQDKTRSHFELYLGNDYKNLKYIGKLIKRTVPYRIHDKYSSTALTTLNMHYAILHNTDGNRMELVDLRQFTRNSYREFDELHFQMPVKYIDGDCYITWLGKDRFFYRLRVAADNGHAGNLEGMAIKDGYNVYVFRDYDLASSLKYGLSGPPCCSLTFQFENKRRFSIRENSCGYYHGVGITFNGQYKMVNNQ